jgi:hypothetical protein
MDRFLLQTQNNIMLHETLPFAAAKCKGKKLLAEQ